METLKIDCMAETVNGVSYRQESKSNISDSLELDNETLQDMLQPMRITQEDLNNLSITADDDLTATCISSNWRMNPIAVNVSDAISTSVVLDYMKFTNDFNEMVKRILGDNEVVFHTEEYLEGLPSKIIHEFCKDLCIMLLEEYNDSEVWTSQIIKSIASSSGRKIDSPIDMGLSKL